MNQPPLEKNPRGPLNNAFATGLLLFVLMLLAFGLGGCGNTDSPTTNVPPAGNVVARSYPVGITAEVPDRATKLRVSGEDVEGETTLNVTLEAARSVTVEVGEDVKTILLEYLDASGNVVASYSESSLNQHDVDFRRGIMDPPLVRFAAPVSTQGTVSQEVHPAVTGDDVKFSFAFFGCNRAKVAGEDPRFEGQISPEGQHGERSSASPAF